MDPSICRHFGDCGGCLHQDLPYEEQLARKGAAIGELFQEWWSTPIPVAASPVLWHYRNKVDPSFSLMHYPEPPPRDFQRETVLGFKRRGQWFWPLAIDECRIGPEGMESLLEGVRQWRLQSGLHAYNARRGGGYLRNLLVRDGKRSGERMVTLITSPGALPAPDAFTAMARNTFGAVSVYHGEFSGKAEVAAAEQLTLLDGSPDIAEIMQTPLDLSKEDLATIALSPAQAIANAPSNARTIRFRISPMSFFQTNPLAAERLYGLIREWSAACGARHLYDLYGGAGGIALNCADCVDDVVSVENVEAASADGRLNAKRNQTPNIHFETDSVRQFLRRQLESGGLPESSAAVTDPPRSGMHPKAVSRLITLRPKHLLYVSCNPKRLREELPLFLEAYRLTDLRAVDMFPHTPHVEVLAAMEAR